MEPEPSSVMSRWEQEGKGTRGSAIEPSSTRVGKHSRSVAEIGRIYNKYCMRNWTRNLSRQMIVALLKIEHKYKKTSLQFV